MALSMTPYIFILLAITLINCSLALYAWRRRYDTVGLQTFMLVMIAITIWFLASAMKTVFSELPMKLFWVNIQIIGVALAPTLWLIFTLEYSGQDKRLPPTYKRYMAVIPLVVIFLDWTNPAHHLLIIDANPSTINGIPILQMQYGPLYLLYTLYAYLLLIRSSIILLQIINDKSNLYRKQALALLMACLLPWAANFVNILFGEAISALLLPLAFFVSSLILVVALFRLRLLDIVPVARESVIENMTDGVIVVDNAGRIADINPAAAHIMNQSSSALIGQQVAQAFANQSTLERNYNAQTAHRSEITRQTDDGTRHYEMKISELWNEEEKLNGKLIVLHDITERKNTARALTQAKISAETASQIKDEFLANMSHELRTPLNSIIGYTDLTLMGTYGTLNEQQQNRLEKVAVNAKHLLQLINDILDISRIESDQLLLNLELVSLPSLLHDCMATVQPAVTAQPIELVMDIPDQLPLIMTDARRFKQIVLNLLTNAIKFTPEGSITLKVQLLAEPDIQKLAIAAQHIPAQTTAPWIFLQVIDTGIGIAPEDQHLVFEDFRQVDGSRTRRYQGSGVGLTIARRLVKKMNGTIWVESAVGSGSAMNIILPAPKEAAKDHDSPTQKPLSTELVIPSDKKIEA